MKLKLKKIKQKQNSSSDIKKIVGSTNASYFQPNSLSQAKQANQQLGQTTNQSTKNPHPQDLVNPNSSQLNQQNFIRASKNLSEPKTKKFLGLNTAFCLSLVGAAVLLCILVIYTNSYPFSVQSKCQLIKQKFLTQSPSIELKKLNCDSYGFVYSAKNIFRQQQVETELQKLATDEKKLIEKSISGKEEQIANLHSQLEGLKTKHGQFSNISGEELYVKASRQDRHLQYLQDLIEYNSPKAEKLAINFKKFETYLRQLEPKIDKSDYLSLYLVQNKVTKNIEYKILEEEFTNFQEQAVNILDQQNKLQGIEKQTFKKDFFSYLILEPEDFKKLGDTATLKIENEFISITGNQEVDQKISTSAKARGYQFRQNVDTSSLIKVNQEESLLSEVDIDMTAMFLDAKNQQIDLELNSGYRSRKDQRELFLGRLEKNFNLLFDGQYQAELLKQEKHDKVIEETIRLAAIPGFSKHHSGKAIDLLDSQDSYKGVPFAQTRAFEWLSKFNYLNAKKYGFVPSYPEGVDDMGPDPEAWEYIWVGKDNLKLEVD